ncbi:hypothetical protein OHS33_34745 [Streptomyces sp. NBC_00536]|uniref:hypothetical protein n=1 Tax=Streptomyces sp. NBC_00536 TaxID=2975769 RepID=UPI002E80C4E5|nr:hypothetical protein [Streptomyces sp. NBC_00536]WUC83077.1 hypothetical protein OHS33_34745 [Streptomyces sp. NBC_00536]
MATNPDRNIDVSGVTNHNIDVSGRTAAVTGEQPALEVTDLGAIPAQIQTQESPTVAVARERLIEAIGREAVFLADQRAGQASGGLESLARAFALVTGSTAALVGNGADNATVGTGRVSSFADWAASS